MSNEGQGSRRDHLTATTPEGKIELTEEELSRTTGGDLGRAVKIKWTTTTKSKVETFF
jgi:hypothetical protein